jgi:hypothetical protein
MNWIAGTVVAGYGVASGQGSDRRYPAGSIRLQQPHFLAKGIDLSPYFAGTLNVDLAPHLPVPRHPVFDDTLGWFDGIEERFLLMPIEIETRGKRVAGLWYYPHPETKAAHFQRGSVVELLLPWIAGLEPGEPVQVGFND